MKVTVAADRRARTSVTGSLPIIYTFLRLSRQCLHTFGETAASHWQIVENPVHPRHLRGGRVRSVRVIDNQRQALRISREVGPGERRRDIFTLAGIDDWNLTLVTEC